jgi:hypothetical protein
VPCDNTKVRLLATVVSEEVPEWSFASVIENGEKSLRRIGDQAGQRVVSWISWKYLFLEGEEDYCYVDLFSEENISPPKKRKKRRRSRPSRRAARREELKKGVKVVSKNERIVDRELVDKMINNPNRLMRGLRFRPYRKRGEVVGYKLRRLSSRSPLSLLGAKKGDVIKEINGVEITSVDKALLAYQKLNSTDDFVFSISRRGKPMELKISIQ